MFVCVCGFPFFPQRGRCRNLCRYYWYLTSAMYDSRTMAHSEASPHTLRGPLSCTVPLLGVTSQPPLIQQAQQDFSGFPHRDTLHLYSKRCCFYSRFNFWSTSSKKLLTMPNVSEFSEHMLCTISWRLHLGRPHVVLHILFLVCTHWIYHG